MTSIALLSGDFEILFDDETDGGDGVVGMKMIRRAAGASATVHTTQALYSAIADATDDFQAMGFENPMLPVTPNAFTLENKYFIDRRSTEFLKEGAISADWTLVGAQGVIAVEWSGGTGPIDADRGSKVTQAGTAHTGTMLDFETLPDAKTITWIRPDTSSDTFSGTGALTNTGTLSTTASVAGTNGTQLYSSIQAIGSVPNATEVYLVQERFKMTSSDASFQWWATDPSVSLGIIDILIRVEKDGVSIADGDVEVFARQYTTQYDNFRLRVNAGGRSALPLASSADINNTTGYRTFTGSTYTGTLEIGDGIYLGANFGVATKKGVLTRQTLSSQTVVEYYLIGDLTDFTNTDALKGYDFATGADTTDLVTVASVPGANLLGPTDPAVGEGGTVTLSLGGFLEDRDGDGSTEPYSIQFDCQGPTNPVPIAKVYERLKYITSRGQIADLITGMNVPGETYRGLEAVIEYDTPTGVLTEGDDMTSV
ncbi:MAG: hypothetical protein KAJ03_10615, partial [Gammaproteobacteria bacterium]|nr:hypothetical protein [Gammaproteobacteria bacterium]